MLAESENEQENMPFTIVRPPSMYSIVKMKRMTTYLVESQFVFNKIIKTKYNDILFKINCE